MLNLIVAALLAASPAQNSEPAELVFSFAGLRDSGAVMVALYDSEAAYKKRSHPLRESRASVHRGQAEARFAGLPAGDYAAMVFHDVNGDGKMNFNRFKLPAEPYAFSNNARGLPLASWRAAVFRAGPGPSRQNIRLR